MQRNRLSCECPVPWVPCWAPHAQGVGSWVELRMILLFTMIVIAEPYFITSLLFMEFISHYCNILFNYIYPWGPSCPPNPQCFANQGWSLIRFPSDKELEKLRKVVRWEGDAHDLQHDNWDDCRDLIVVPRWRNLMFMSSTRLETANKKLWPLHGAAMIGGSLSQVENDWM